MHAVIDASVAAYLLLDGESSNLPGILGTYESLHAPNHFDVECLSVLRRAMIRGSISAEFMRARALVVLSLPVERHGIGLLIPRILTLCHNATVYDAAYIALAEGLDADFLTTDRRLATVPGITCRVVHPSITNPASASD